MTARIDKVDVIVSSPSRNFVTIKITTSDGIVGWGDATLNGRELAVASYLQDHVAPLLIGLDPDRIEDIWQFLYRGVYWRRGPVTMAAIGGIDLALWDIKGKSVNRPVYQLLGGAVREKILTYTHTVGWDISALKAALDVNLARGFKALRVQSGVPGLDSVYGVTQGAGGYEPASRGAYPKLEMWDSGKYLRHVPKVIEAAREHVGPDIELLHDAHHRLTPIQAAQLGKSLEPFGLFWLEDVTPGENQEALKLIREHSTIPLAIGEVFNTIWDFKDLIINQQLDYVRCSVMHAGGISHTRRIFDLAALYGIKFGPHGPSDISPITMSASLHVDIATPNLGIQEFMGYDPLVSEVFHSSYTLIDGYLHPGDNPGLGVEFDEKAAAKFPYAPAYLPYARSLDGTVTDW